MADQHEDLDSEVLDWAAEMWPELRAGRLSIKPYGAGVALLRETHQGTMQILIAIDHAEGRMLLGRLLRHHHIAHEIKRLGLEPPPPPAPQPTSRIVGSMLKPTRPKAPAVPQPYLQSPSAAPPAHDDLARAFDFAVTQSVYPSPPADASDDDHQPSSSTSSLDAGGGDTGGGCDSGDRD